MTHPWKCPYCEKVFHKDTPSGLGMARENHMRKHRPPVHPVWILRDYVQYPESICGEMGGNCMNCPVPANMRWECQAAQEYERERRKTT